MEALLRDIRFGLKLLLKEKTFSATVLLTLAVCVGANVAIFSVIHTVLLEPLPYAHPDRLRTMEERISTSLGSREAPLMLLLAFAGIALFLAVVGIYEALA